MRNLIYHRKVRDIGPYAAGLKFGKSYSYTVHDDVDDDSNILLKMSFCQKLSLGLSTDKKRLPHMYFCKYIFFVWYQ